MELEMRFHISLYNQRKQTIVESDSPSFCMLSTPTVMIISQQHFSKFLPSHFLCTLKNKLNIFC